MLKLCKINPFIFSDYLRLVELKYDSYKMFTNETSIYTIKRALASKLYGNSDVLSLQSSWVHVPREDWLIYIYYP